MKGVAPQNWHVKSLAQEFLRVHWDQKSPLLLGYSGGSDSKALLYALLECGVRPHIAHVDHGWREESKDEAEMLRKEAVALGCPFFSIRLELEKKEDVAREARFRYFSSLFSGYQALLLAHQAEDLAETVLKRLLEGAHLSRLGAIEPVSQQYGMAIWRPFLFCRKAQILQFIEEKGLQHIVDSSNADPVYLRARMRTTIFPFLNESFGKETIENLILLSQRAHELRAYLDRKVEAVPILRGPWGVIIDLKGLERMEKRHLIQKMAREEGVSFTRPQLEELLEEKNSKIKIGQREIWADKTHIYFSSTRLK